MQLNPHLLRHTIVNSILSGAILFNFQVNCLYVLRKHVHSSDMNTAMVSVVRDWHIIYASQLQPPQKWHTPTDKYNANTTEFQPLRPKGASCDT